MSGPDKITTPRGEIFLVHFKNGNVRAELKWNTDIAKVLNGQFDAAQKALDNEILRGCSPLVPFRTGMLEKSGQLGTVVGSGEIRYIAPYAKAQYYRKKMGSNGQANRGPYWFERWKNASGVAVVAKIKAMFRR